MPENSVTSTNNGMLYAPVLKNTHKKNQPPLLIHLSRSHELIRATGC